MNPSAAEIVEAIDATPADEVLVLPNNSNVHPRGRAGRGARDEAGSRHPVALGAGGPGGDRALHPDEHAGARTRRTCSTRSPRSHRRGDRRLARRRARRHQDREGRVPRARRGRSRDRRRRASRTSRSRSSSACSTASAAGSAILTGEGAPPVEELLAAVERRAPGRRRRGARRRPAALPAARRGGVESGMRPIRVLLVEDNEVYRDSLAFLLGPPRRSRGRRARSATAEAAPPVAAELEADVAVVDYRLPDLDGARGRGSDPRALPRDRGSSS